MAFPYFTGNRRLGCGGLEVELWDAVATISRFKISEVRAWRIERAVRNSF
jgi:hypothetical protein